MNARDRFVCAFICKGRAEANLDAADTVQVLSNCRAARVDLLLREQIHMWSFRISAAGGQQDRVEARHLRTER